MNPDTFDVLKQAHLTTRENLAAAIANLLLKTPVATMADVDDNALINDEIRVGLFGDSYAEHVMEELNEMVGELTRPRGDVYDHLPDTVSLCTAPVRRKTLTEAGVSVVVQKNGRFVSEDPDVVMGFRIDPQVQRLERTMERIATTIREDTERIPALATRTPGVLNRANATMQRELPASSQNGAS